MDIRLCSKEDLDRATARVLIHSGLFSSSIASAIWLYQMILRKDNRCP